MHPHGAQESSKIFTQVLESLGGWKALASYEGVHDDATAIARLKRSAHGLFANRKRPNAGCWGFMYCVGYNYKHFVG